MSALKGRRVNVTRAGAPATATSCTVWGSPPSAFGQLAPRAWWRPTNEYNCKTLGPVVGRVPTQAPDPRWLLRRAGPNCDCPSWDAAAGRAEAGTDKGHGGWRQPLS